MPKTWRPVCLVVILALVLSLGAVLAPAVMTNSGVASANGGQVLYGADGAAGNPSCNLYILDPTTGAVLQTVGPIGYAVTGLAFAPDGTLYGSTGQRSLVAPYSLIRIDTTTGAGTLIGGPLIYFGSAPQSAADISFSPDGTLYGWIEGNYDDLATINLSTGQATIVGNSGLETSGSGLAFSSGGTLYFTGDDDDGWLRTIDPSTGLPTNVVMMDGEEEESIGALSFSASGVLYGERKLSGAGGGGPRDLITINTTTGHITSLGSTVNALDAIAFSPPPRARRVGGEVYPVNKLGILAPWIGLAVLSIGGITWFTLRRRKAYR